MRLKILKCPACQTNMLISELKCPKCDLRLKKDFEPCKFCKLPESEYEFLLLFLRTQGKITELEKILNLSYPTIKAKIENLLKLLELTTLDSQADPIEALAQGKISVDEAVTILKQRRKR